MEDLSSGDLLRSTAKFDFLSFSLPLDMIVS